MLIKVLNLLKTCFGLDMHTLWRDRDQHLSGHGPEFYPNLNLDLVQLASMDPEQRRIYAEQILQGRMLAHRVEEEAVPW